MVQTRSGAGHNAKIQESLRVLRRIQLISLALSENYRKFRKYQRNRHILSINSKARTQWLDAGFPVLDVFHITMACQARTCTNDGSHYNQMVNRAKAQMLLNYFCQPPTCKKLEPS
ncbi:unnamed protein product [Bathycoccus prasinos]